MALSWELTLIGLKREHFFFKDMRHFSDYLAIPKSDQLKLNFLGGLLLEDKRLTRDNLELFGVKYGPITRRRLLILSIPEELRLIFLIQESS